MICLANNVKNQGVAKIILNNFYFILFFFYHKVQGLLNFYLRINVSSNHDIALIMKIKESNIINLEIPII